MGRPCCTPARVNTGAIARIDAGQTRRGRRHARPRPLGRTGGAERRRDGAPDRDRSGCAANAPNNHIAERLDELDELLAGFPCRTGRGRVQATSNPSVGPARRSVRYASSKPTWRRALARDLIRAIEEDLLSEEIADAGAASIVLWPTRLQSKARGDRADSAPIDAGCVTWWRSSDRPAWARRPRSPSSPPTPDCTMGARVGLVTVDTYRVAAVDQLKTYAEIIDLPMRGGRHARWRCARPWPTLADLDLVLIDTAGRSPRDSQRIEELRTMLEAASPSETHLVLSRSPRRWRSRIATRGSSVTKRSR